MQCIKWELIPLVRPQIALHKYQLLKIKLELNRIYNTFKKNIFLSTMAGSILYFLRTTSG